MQNQVDTRPKMLKKKSRYQFVAQTCHPTVDNYDKSFNKYNMEFEMVDKRKKKHLHLLAKIKA